MSRLPTLSDDEIVRRARAVFVERCYAARTKEIAAAVGLTVLDLLVGDVARRFMLCEPERPPIERVLRLVEARATVGSA